MKFENLEKRVYVAKNNSDEMNLLIREYIPYIRKTAGKTVPSEVYDSYSTTAMTAFAEAVIKFRKEKGKFLTYASVVITNRIMDQIRKEYKSNEIPSEEIDSIDSTGNERDNSLEVDMFRKELAEFGIVFEDLLKNSPKHKTTKIKADRAAEILARSDSLINDLFRTKKIPIKRLSEISGITSKLIEQKRKYIIARTLLKQKKYLYLREYVK